MAEANKNEQEFEAIAKDMRFLISRTRDHLDKVEEAIAKQHDAGISACKGHDVTIHMHNLQQSAIAMGTPLEIMMSLHAIDTHSREVHPITLGMFMAHLSAQLRVWKLNRSELLGDVPKEKTKTDGIYEAATWLERLTRKHGN